MAVQEKELIVCSEKILFQRQNGIIWRYELMHRIEVQAAKYGVPILFGPNGQVRKNGIFGKPIANCFYIYHPQYAAQYCCFCIVEGSIGNMDTFQVCITGGSRQNEKNYMKNDIKIMDGSGARGILTGAIIGGAVGTGFAIGSAVTGTVKTGIKAVAKGIGSMMTTTNPTASLFSESDWYDAIKYFLHEVFYE